jgi:hypothetical protein
MRHSGEFKAATMPFDDDGEESQPSP